MVGALTLSFVKQSYLALSIEDRRLALTFAEADLVSSLYQTNLTLICMGLIIQKPAAATDPGECLHANIHGYITPYASYLLLCM